jgi:flavin reductase (DIM6/NTAB) family NADH-FMN oxidoreductase RutF
VGLYRFTDKDANSALQIKADWDFSTANFELLKLGFSKPGRRLFMYKDDNVFNWLPCPVVFVCTSHGDRRGIMTATAMFVSEKEPLLAISVAKNHLTEKLIGQTGKFTVVIAGEDQKQLALKVGSSKGESVDKFEKFSIKTVPGLQGSLSIPEGSAARMECEVEDSRDIEGYRIFIGRVVGQQDMGKAPLVWHKDVFFGLQPV